MIGSIEFYRRDAAKGRAKHGPNARKGKSQEAPPLPSGPPPNTPATWMANLQRDVRRPLDLKANDEFHRIYWLPLSHEHQKVPMPAETESEMERFATKKQLWGQNPTTGYRVGNWYIENQWAMRKKLVQRAKSDPSINLNPKPFGPTKEMMAASRGVTSCLTGYGR